MQRSQTHFPDRAIAVTADDDAYFTPSTLLVIDGGDLVVEPAVGGNTVTLTGCPAYYVVPFRVVRVLETSVASDILRIS